MTRGRAAALLLGSAACWSIAAPARGQPASTLHIAAVPLESASEAAYARDMGFFAKSGIVSDIQTMVNGAAIAAAIVSGGIDVGFIPLDVLASIHQKGIPLVVIAPCTEYVSGAQTGALLVSADSPVHSGKDLEGKTIAVVALNGVTHLATRAWIDRNGGDSATVKFVELPPSAMPAALNAGRVDAAYDGEPYLEIAKKTSRVLFYGNDAIAKHYLSSAWCADIAWARDHLDVVDRFAVAMHETAAWANKNQARAGELFATYSKTDPAIVASTPRVRFTERLTPALIQPLIDAAAKYNGFKSFPAQDILYAPPR
jgi:NitT/TauT family transport system substrate-binding protein